MIKIFQQPGAKPLFQAGSLHPDRALCRAPWRTLHSASGLVGGFVGASGLSILYSWDFRYPLLAIGLGYGLCVLIGGSLIRRSEGRNRLYPSLSPEPQTEEVQIEIGGEAR